VQAQGLFNDVAYTQLIAIIDLAVKQAMLTNDNFEMEFVSPFSNNFINISYIFFLFSCKLELRTAIIMFISFSNNTGEYEASKYSLHNMKKNILIHNTLQISHLFFTEYLLFKRCEPNLLCASEIN